MSFQLKYKSNVNSHYKNIYPCPISWRDIGQNQQDKEDRISRIPNWVSLYGIQMDNFWQKKKEWESLKDQDSQITLTKFALERGHYYTKGILCYPQRLCTTA